MNVAVIGASDKPDRYSHKALLLLREYGHTTYPIHPVLHTIEGVPVFASLRDVPAPIDVVTIYLAPDKQEAVAPDILRRRPARVIFNPGAENPALAARLERQGIQVVNACTLVLLKTGQFER